MGEGTSMSRLEDECRQNRSEIAALQKGQIELGSSIRNIEKMLHDSMKMKQPFHHSSVNFSEFLGDSHTGRWPKGMKTELPMFDGENVEEWTFRAREYFEAYAVPDEMRVRLLSFHMSGPAYTWYRWCINNGLEHTWETFLEALCTRFGKSIFHDPKAAMKELRQTATVAEYQHQFEALSNQVTGLNEEWLISLFAGGLTETLKCELLLAKPSSYVEAVALAKLHEQKNQTYSVNLRPHGTRTTSTSFIANKSSHLGQYLQLGCSLKMDLWSLLPDRVLGFGSD